MMPAITEDVSDKAGAIQRNLASSVAAVRENAELSTDGKVRRLARAYRDASRAMNKLREDWQGKAAVDSRSLGRDLFGTASAVGADAISVRDADDRAARVERVGDALDLMHRAHENGDEVLVRALAQRAYRERSNPFGGGWAPVLDTYVEMHPEVGEKLAQLEDARRNNLRNSVTAGLIFSVPRPPELGRIPDHKLDDVAEGRLAGDPASSGG
jgi:hypothetical protein